MEEKNESETSSVRDGDQSDKLPSKTSSVPMHRQNSSNSISSLPTSISPNNSSTENISAIESGIADQELNCSEKRTKGKTSMGGTNTSKDEGGNCEKVKNVGSNLAICSLTLKEEDATVLSVKKEERSLSPVSPVGFDTVTSLPNADLGAGRTDTAKLDDMSMAASKGNNVNNEKISSPLNNGIVCKDEFIGNNLTNNPNIGVASLAPQQSFSNNCLEFMQQQNHVFVFSTQLANKAAESVLSGQFHSIIAYHCTQPQTKNFLDEFFMKNPMKMSKIPPRNMNNMAPQNMGHMHQWNAGGGGVNSIPKNNQKTNSINNKSLGFHTMLNANPNVEQKPAIGKIPFSEGGDTDADLLQGWDAAGRMEGKTCSEGNVGIGTNLDSIPFLQGRKIPDENLTPQQRQHREEQLAKLKKMNQFLFPENDSTQPTKQPGAENIPPGMGNLLMNMASGSRNLQNPQKLPITGMCGGPDDSLSNVNLLAAQNQQMNAILQAKSAPSTTGLGCDNINSNIMNTNNAITPTANILMSNTGSEVANMPLSGGNNFNPCNAGDDVNPLEWSKVQHQNLNRLNSTATNVAMNARPNAMQNNASVCNTQRTQPPPPYHSTQRSASVPIATQSPNPSSPNNPTSNLSMPSPASSGVPVGSAASGGPMTNSPSMDVISTTTNTTNSKTGGFTQEANNNLNRNRQLSSNPSTPLSHMSPKDMDNFNPHTSVADSQQSSNEGRYPSSSPGFNFPPHLQNSSSALGGYKSQLDRPGGVPNTPFISGGRRTDNLPLNPNSNRMSQGKLGPNLPFDPISSLAQMSQQLTSCVTSGPVGNNGNHPVSNASGSGELGMSVSNVGLSHHQGMDGMLQQSIVDGGMLEGGGIMSGGGSPFGPNSMNSMMVGSGHPMNPQHRLLNPKMCGGFNNNNAPGSGNFNGIPPNPHHPHHHRLRMSSAMNFNNFNPTPNVQVKASTPNTIQYLPVRPQNNNNSSTMRAPLSLDFLPRYPLNSGQVTDNHNSHILGGPVQTDVAGKMNNNMNSGNSQHVGNNNAAAVGMNFFQHCQAGEQDDIASSGGNGSGMIPSSHDMMRGLRPMLRPGTGNPNPNMQQYGSQQHQDPLDCGDLFGNTNANTNPNQMFQMNSGKPGNNKLGSGILMGGNGGGMCQNLVGNIPNLEHGGMNSANMIGPGVMPNSNNGNNAQLPTGPNNNMNYKPFVGPSSNDLKYAQQYHSFQQQLYATSTRSQQNGNNLATPAAANVQNTPFYNK